MGKETRFGTEPPPRLAAVKVCALAVLFLALLFFAIRAAMDWREVLAQVRAMNPVYIGIVCVGALAVFVYVIANWPEVEAHAAKLPGLHWLERAESRTEDEIDKPSLVPAPEPASAPPDSGGDEIDKLVSWLIGERVVFDKYGDATLAQVVVHLEGHFNRDQDLPGLSLNVWHALFSEPDEITIKGYLDRLEHHGLLTRRDIHSSAPWWQSTPVYAEVCGRIRSTAGFAPLPGKPLPDPETRLTEFRFRIESLAREESRMSGANTTQQVAESWQERLMALLSAYLIPAAKERFRDLISRARVHIEISYHNQSNWHLIAQGYKQLLAGLRSDVTAADMRLDLDPKP